MTREEFLRAFIADPESVIKHHTIGLCRNYSEQRDITAPKHLYKDIDITAWEHYSGSVVFPVPPGAEQFFDHHDNLYEGEQLDYRISLAKFILKELGYD